MEDLGLVRYRDVSILPRICGLAIAPDRLDTMTNGMLFSILLLYEEIV